MTKRYLFANWKMNLTEEESINLAKKFANASSTLKNTVVGVAPSMLNVSATKKAVQNSLLVGAQNVYFEDSGAFTGEVSVQMLKAINADFTLTGHSERRNVFGETDELVAKRTKKALDENLITIFCIGEKLDARESGQTNKVLQTQMDALISLLENKNYENLIIAYEPVWAIGTGKVATTKEIKETHSFIATYWEEKTSFTCPPILYGGSVKPDNYEEIIKVPLVSGALVGGAALKEDQFVGLMEISEK
ncbi:MAG: triose-phosphate isomerase [Bdellovibrionota bacterium]